MGTGSGEIDEDRMGSTGGLTNGNFSELLPLVNSIGESTNSAFSSDLELVDCMIGRGGSG